MTQILKFNQVDKDRLFYGQWQYCISFHLDEVSALKNLDHEFIDALIERRKLWRDVARQRWKTIKTPIVPSMHANRRYRDITEQTVENLHDLAETLLKSKTPYKLVTSIDQAWVYTNSKGFVKKLASNTTLKDQHYSEAVISRPKNTIVLRSPTHTHRSYFKSTKLTDYEKQTLTNFFVNQIDYVRTGPALAKWLAMPFHRTQDYFFVDHDGESWLIMLALIKPGLIRKTVEIVPA